MKLLLDTQIFIRFVRGTLQDTQQMQAVLARDDAEFYMSVASIWEIAIKVRLGKLDAGMQPEDIEAYCAAVGIQLVPISAAHASLSIMPEPPTRDPFDRMLLAQCAVDGMKLVTVNQLLVDHPLALKL